VKSGVIHTVFDHTSLLRYLIDKWGLGPLGARVANANTFSSFLLTKPEATDRLPVISADTALDSGQRKYGQIEERRQPALNAHQSALVGMTQLLESMTEVKTEALLGRAKRVVTGYDGVADVAIERVEQFLGQQSAIAKG
jgi:phospholipase C